MVVVAGGHGAADEKRRHILRLLAQRGVDVMATPVIERAAFREMFDRGVTMYDMESAKVSNLDKALQNARQLADEVMRHLPVRVISTTPKKRPWQWGRAA